MKVSWGAILCGTTPKTIQDKSSDIGVKNLIQKYKLLSKFSQKTSPNLLYICQDPNLDTAGTSFIIKHWENCVELSSWLTLPVGMEEQGQIMTNNWKK